MRTYHFIDVILIIKKKKQKHGYGSHMAPVFSPLTSGDDKIDLKGGLPHLKTKKTQGGNH